MPVCGARLIGGRFIFYLAANRAMLFKSYGQSAINHPASEPENGLCDSYPAKRLEPT